MLFTIYIINFILKLTLLIADCFRNDYNKKDTAIKRCLLTILSLINLNYFLVISTVTSAVSFP